MSQIKFPGPPADRPPLRRPITAWWKDTRSMPRWIDYSVLSRSDLEYFVRFFESRLAFDDEYVYWGSD